VANVVCEDVKNHHFSRDCFWGKDDNEGAGGVFLLTGTIGTERGKDLR